MTLAFIRLETAMAAAVFPVPVGPSIQTIREGFPMNYLLFPERVKLKPYLLPKALTTGPGTSPRISPPN